jgi:hypothetical protein
MNPRADDNLVSTKPEEARVQVYGRTRKQLTGVGFGSISVIRRADI